MHDILYISVMTAPVIYRIREDPRLLFRFKLIIGDTHFKITRSLDQSFRWDKLINILYKCFSLKCFLHPLINNGWTHSKSVTALDESLKDDRSGRVGARLGVKTYHDDPETVYMRIYWKGGHFHCRTWWMSEGRGVMTLFFEHCQSI